MRSSAPLVSIIIPVFNNEETLCKTIDSVLAQTFGDWELIIVDDGSTDRSLEIATSYRERDVRIRCVAQANSGAGSARNTALAMAVGRYVALLDGDDQCFPNRLAIQVDYLSLHSEIDVLGGAIVEVDLRTERELGVSYSPCEHETLVREIWYRSPFFTPTVMAKREFFECLAGFSGPVRRAEDYDLWLRGVCGPQAGKHTFSPEFLRGQDYDLWIRGARGFRYGNINVPLVRYRRKVRPHVRDAWWTSRIVVRRGLANGLGLATAWYALRPFLSLSVNVPLAYICGTTTWLRRMSRLGARQQ